MASSASVLGFEMHDALHAILSAEMHPGGKLPTLRSLRKSNQLAQNAVVGPTDVVGGVKLHGHSDPRPYGTGAREVDVHLEIILAARAQRVAAAPGVSGKVALLEDALSALKSAIDDGQGGGVIAVLNAPSTYGLRVDGQPLAAASRLGAGQFYEDLDGEGADQSVWALYTVDYIATGYFSF
jgi:hypothetical protein